MCRRDYVGRYKKPEKQRRQPNETSRIFKRGDALQG